jgi:hypothetical protein
MSEIEIAVFRKSGGVLSKRISLTRSGKIKSDGSECQMTTGTARRVKLNDIRSLANLIENLRSDEALTLGRLRDDLPTKVRVVLKRDLNGSRSDTIARTGEYLTFAPGKPAYLLLDHDRQGIPEEIAEKLRDARGFWNAIIATIPELARAARVSRSSTSAGLFHKATNERLSRSPNRHVYLAIKDGADIKRALKTLHDRLWLAGYGYFAIGAVGQSLDRSIIDTAVYGPERLVFESAPILVAPVGQDQKVRRPKVQDGDIIDTRRAIPALTEQEAKRVDELKAAGRKLLAHNAAATRERWAKKFAVEHGLSNEEAEKIATAASKYILHSEFSLVFDEPNLGTCTVADVLADPDKYVGETLADPLEGVAYGRGKAKVYRQPDGVMMINSFAHGGIKYRLVDRDTDHVPRGELPLIRIADGQIARVVDEAQDALIKSRLPIFINGGRLVEPITVEREAADGQTTL